ncbi:zinc ribbon domain-containing protein [Streptococcus sp. H49]|uniref:zinc ribbon domain-containing protein n=1 Tax=Streptococcus huangxiaojuni TaxID=3237239 RepID=UPI0034A2078A
MGKKMWLQFTEAAKRQFAKKGVQIGLGVFVLVLLFFGIWGRMVFSKTNLIRDYVAARSDQSGDPFENIKGYLVWADTKEKVTNDDVKYAKYSPISKQQADELKEELERADESDDYYVERVGTRFFFFPDYRIAMKPMSLTIKTNLPNMDVLLNQKRLAASDSEDFSVTVDRLPIADDYTASISGRYNDKTVELSKSYDGENPVLDLFVTFKNFTVNSNLTDGDLYFGETKVAALANGTYQVEDYPVTDSADAYVKKTFEDGNLESNKQPLADIAEGGTVDLNVDNLLDETGAVQHLQTVFDQLSAYAETKQDPSNVTAVFEKGTDNDFYKALKESVADKLENDRRKASDFTVSDVTLNSLEQVGKESYLLNFAVSYAFYYDKATDTDKSSYGNIVQALTGQLTLKKSDSGYLVAQEGQKNLTVTWEDNQVQADPDLPEGLLGSWEAKQSDKTISLTFAEDGTVTKTIDYKSNKKEDRTVTAVISSLETVADSTYRYVYEAGSDPSAFVAADSLDDPDNSQYGFKLEDSKLTLLIWEDGKEKTDLTLKKK